VSRAQYAQVERREPCVLEAVSKLAREPWTDRPTCVHPVLGSVARVVHDYSSKTARRALLPLAPSFIGTAQSGFERSARLVALCASTALAGPTVKAERNRLAGAQQTALFLLGSAQGPGGAARWWLPFLDRFSLSEPFYRTFVATEHAAEAVAVVARASGDDRDVRLRQLLKQCLATVGGLRLVEPIR
jgi:hypothetical protein